MHGVIMHRLCGLRHTLDAVPLRPPIARLGSPTHSLMKMLSQMNSNSGGADQLEVSPRWGVVSEAMSPPLAKVATSMSNGINVGEHQSHVDELSPQARRGAVTERIGAALCALLSTAVGGLTTSRPMTFDQGYRDEPGVAVWPAGVNQNRSELDVFGENRCLFRCGNAYIVYHCENMPDLNQGAQLMAVLLRAWNTYLEHRGYGEATGRKVPVRVLDNFLVENDVPRPTYAEHPDKLRDGFNVIVLAGHVMYYVQEPAELRDLVHRDDLWSCALCNTRDFTRVVPGTAWCNNDPAPQRNLCTACAARLVRDFRLQFEHAAVEYFRGDPHQMLHIIPGLVGMTVAERDQYVNAQYNAADNDVFVCPFCRLLHRYNVTQAIEHAIETAFEELHLPHYSDPFAMPLLIGGGFVNCYLHFKYRYCCVRFSTDGCRERFEPVHYNRNSIVEYDGKYWINLDHMVYQNIGLVCIYDNCDLSIWSDNDTDIRCRRGHEYQVEVWQEHTQQQFGGLVPVCMLDSIDRLVCTQSLGPARTTATQMLAQSHATKIPDWVRPMLRSDQTIDVANAANLAIHRREVAQIPLRRYFNNVGNQLVMDMNLTAAQLDAMLIGQTVDGNSRWARLKRKLFSFLSCNAAGQFSTTRFLLPYILAGLAGLAGFTVSLLSLPATAVCLSALSVIGMVGAVYDTRVLLRKQQAVGRVEDLQLLDRVVGRLFGPLPCDSIQGWGTEMKTVRPVVQLSSSAKPFLCKHGVERKTCSLCKPLKLCVCGDWIVDRRCPSCENAEHSDIARSANYLGLFRPRQSGTFLKTIPHSYDALRPSTLVTCPPAGARFEPPKHQDDHSLHRERGAIYLAEWHPCTGHLPPMVPNKGCHGPRMAALAICSRALKWPRVRSENEWDNLCALVDQHSDAIFGPTQIIFRVDHTTWRDKQGFSEYKKAEFDEAARSISRANAIASGCSVTKQLRDWRVRNAFTKTELLYKYIAPVDAPQPAPNPFVYQQSDYTPQQWATVLKQYEPWNAMDGVEPYVPRLIQAFHPIANLMYNAFILSIHNFFKLWWRGPICYAAGLNAITMGAWFAELSNGSHNYGDYDAQWDLFENDFSVYDSTQSDRTHRLMISICDRLGLRFDLLARSCKKMMSTTGRGATRYRQRYQTPRQMVGMSSGAGDTTTQNTIINVLSHFYVVHKQHGLSWVEFTSSVRMIAMGDDNVLAIRKHLPLDTQRAVNDFAELGFVAKLKQVDFVNVRFCGSRPTPAIVDGKHTLVMCQTLGRLGPKLAVSCFPQPDYSGWLGSNARAVWPIQQCTPGFSGLLAPFMELKGKGMVDQRRKEFFSIGGHIVQPVPVSYTWATARYNLTRADFDDFDTFNLRCPIFSIRSHFVMDRAWEVDVCN